MLSCFNCVRLFATPWAVAHQASLSMGFSRQEYWSGLPFSSAQDLPDPGTEPTSLMCPALAGGFCTTSATSQGNIKNINNELDFGINIQCENQCIHFSSVQFSRSVVSDSLWPRELQHARPPCPSPTPGVHSDSLPSSRWCHPAISSSVVPFSSCPQSLPASESFPMSQLFTWGGQSTGVSALALLLPKKSQGWSPSEWTGWISLQSKGLSRVFSNITVQKHQFFDAQLSSQSNSHIYTWPLEKP